MQAVRRVSRWGPCLAARPGGRDPPRGPAAAALAVPRKPVCQARRHAGSAAVMGSIGRIVVVGAGLAGVQACACLRDNGFAGALSLIAAEPGLPYERPALSKTYLHGQTDIALRSQAFYENKSIELITGRVTGIDRAGKVVRLETGPSIGYD